MTFALHTCAGLPLLMVVATVAAREPSAGAVCTIEGASNCQLPADAATVDVATGFLSDLTAPPNGVVSADDFVPWGATLTQVCVWGFYHDATAGGSSAWVRAMASATARWPVPPVPQSPRTSTFRSGPEGIAGKLDAGGAG